MGFTDIVTLTIGTPTGFGGELILYTICGILLLVVIQGILDLFYALARIPHKI